ncbi:hypothetical protein [Roseovarius sp. MMSF_3281]|uniref:zinc finger domain-containing protein n=1 Tax=Roseovarius sp. MMSF_3281 TaxID=3046694 RepID=UPI00273FCA5F|nr:hypothetical protein [Roseovarius sp. MMSF_3281]
MTRDEIIETTDCPKCGAKPGQPCRKGDGSDRAQRKNHVERVYRAQDIAAGKPDRFTGKLNDDHQADRRCPICHKLLKSRQGATDHMVGAHGMSRSEAKKQRKAYVLKAGSKANKMGYSQKAESDDFDLIDDGDTG